MSANCSLVQFLPDEDNQNLHVKMYKKIMSNLALFALSGDNETPDAPDEDTAGAEGTATMSDDAGGFKDCLPDAQVETPPRRRGAVVTVRGAVDGTAERR